MRRFQGFRTQRFPILPFLLAAALGSVSCGGSSEPDVPTAPLTRIGTEVGDQAPNFTLPDPSGGTISLTQFRGNVVLLDFWASWCDPCVAMLPEIQSVQERYADRKFTVVGVSLDSTVDAWRTFLDAEEFDWVHALDDAASPSSAARAYKLASIPVTFLLDPKGKIVAINKNGEELDRLIEENLP